MAVIDKTKKLNTVFLKKDYHNYYTDKTESCVLRWNIEEGFRNHFEAKAQVRNRGMNPKAFRYFQFGLYVYAVGVQNARKQIVMARDVYWANIEGKGLIKYPYTELMPYLIERKCSGNLFSTKMAMDLMNASKVMFFEISEPFKFTSYKNLSHSSLSYPTVFAMAMFDRYIPVYELNVVDDYYNSWDEMPSRKSLWSRGVVALNPFNGKHKSTKDGKPYALEAWLLEHK